MSNFIGAMDEINELLEERAFLGNAINVRAKKDFKFLCNKTRYSSFDNINYQTVQNMNSDELGDFLVVGYDMARKEVSFPKELLDVKNEKLYVAVVGYKNGNVIDIYIFKATEFAKTGIFSMYKYNKKSDSYGIAMPNESKLKEYSFGYIMENIEKQI